MSLTTAPRLSVIVITRNEWMRHSGWSPDPVLRLFPRGAARFSDDLVHERFLCDLPTRTVANDKMNRYSSGRAVDLYARGRRGGLGSAIGHGFWAFVRTYVLKRGFLDGRMGFILAVHNAETSYYRYLKMWLECNDLKR